VDYLLDTNIIIIYSRQNKLAEAIEKQLNLFSKENKLYVSIVTLGEIDAIIKKNNIGTSRQNKIKKLLDSIYKIGLEYTELISKYGDVDAYIQGKIKVAHVKFTSRNMGKNDLWIAATGSHFNLKLLTADKDFAHLNKVYLEVEEVDLALLQTKLK